MVSESSTTVVALVSNSSSPIDAAQITHATTINVVATFEGLAFAGAVSAVFEVVIEAPAVQDITGATLRSRAITFALIECPDGYEETTNNNEIQICSKARKFWFKGSCRECEVGMTCYDNDDVPLTERIVGNGGSLALEAGYHRQSFESRRIIYCDGGPENHACPGGFLIAGWVATKWKCLFVALQIIASFPTSLGIPAPPVFGKIYGVLSITSLHIPGNRFSVERYTMYTSLLVMTLAPLVVCAASVAVNVVINLSRGVNNSLAAIERREGRRRRRISHLVYENLFLPRAKFARTDSRFIRNYVVRDAHVGVTVLAYFRYDLALRASGKAYHIYRIYATISVVTHVIGFPAFCATLLARARPHLDPVVDGARPRHRRPTLAATSALVEAAAEARLKNPTIFPTRSLWIVYRPSYFYWEIVELCRRVCITCVPVFVGTTEVARSLASVILAFASLSVHPFLDDTDNALYESIQWITFTVAFVFFRIVTNSETDGDHVLGTLLVLGVCAIVVTAFVSILFDLRNEQAAVKAVIDSTHLAFKSTSIALRLTSASLEFLSSTSSVKVSELRHVIKKAEPGGNRDDSDAAASDDDRDDSASDGDGDEDNAGNDDDDDDDDKQEEEVKR
ncbi:hypothetical protein CTAYLR_007607 [Chrysophaeum taylorii]|uniref:Uncharacterized protein n=1 Tax=Chrysophaeum taylorii TaxID=2483200 RepID=A0AAD7U839_9STRA|nr:hypothetical protein CTAYLR_007607 [Chrysophaeum taylorii]